MANPFPSSDADDPLALFGPEVETPAPAATATPASSKSARPDVVPPPLKPVAEFKPVPPKAAASIGGAPADDAGNVIYPTASVLEKLAKAVPESTPASRDLAVEVVGPPPSAGSVSFDRIASIKGLGFVEGVALIQTTCEAVMAAGEAAGVPELHGLFLTADGDVILHGPPTGEAPARELARLLHQLVPPNLMPPAGRLFVGRWINNDAQSLSEFSSELAYFARPNSRELLGSLHSRCEGVRTPAQVHRLEPRQKAAPAPQPAAQLETRPEPEQPPRAKRWKLRKADILVAAVVLLVTTTTAIATLLSNPASPKAKPPIEGTPAVEENAKPSERLTANPRVPPTRAAKLTAPTRAVNSGKGAGNAGTGGGGRGADGSAGPNRRAAVIPPPLGRRRSNGNQPSTATLESQDAARGVPAESPAAILPSRQAPDLRIYSANDAGIEPPRLRSAEIPELLIAGFEKRTNQVELVISERGEVQQARMIGPPQRMPDIMLLSRAKELLFDPAIRNGIPVRYRLILSWNVTP
jgi:hypothetical protein